MSHSYREAGFASSAAGTNITTRNALVDRLLTELDDCGCCPFGCIGDNVRALQQEAESATGLYLYCVPSTIICPDDMVTQADCERWAERNDA